ncbi:MAG: hypothetical protein FJZ98_09595 [Chloroflexi bacterium]|nr:hypothetical protein [Chloroflexota bacterium]
MVLHQVDYAARQSPAGQDGVIDQFYLIGQLQINPAPFDDLFHRNREAIQRNHLRKSAVLNDMLNQIPTGRVDCRAQFDLPVRVFHFIQCPPPKRKTPKRHASGLR